MSEHVANCRGCTWTPAIYKFHDWRVECDNDDCPEMPCVTAPTRADAIAEWNKMMELKP